MQRPRLVAEALELTRLPATTIEMSGDEGCRSLYTDFTRRHARWRVIQSKRWGVALLRIPNQFDDYLQGPERSHLRREVNRAYRAGFRFAPIDGLARLDEVLAINQSAEERQGQPMLPGYLDEGTMRRYFERSADVFGVTDTGGVLRAYISLHTCGEVASLELVLGHADTLRQGVMWPLFAETIRELVRRRQVDGRPTWFMYDTFAGATQGMRQFKHWIGFEPYKVTWSWQGQGSTATGPGRSAASDLG